MICSRASTRCGVLRRCVPTCTTRPCLRAAATILWPSTMSVRDRLLHPNIGAGLHGRNHRQRVPVVGRGHQADVQVLLLQHLAVIAEQPGSLLRCLPGGHHLRRLRQHLLVHVAHRNHLDGRHLDQAEQIALAVPPRTDNADTLRFLVRQLFGHSPGGQTQAGSPGTQEFAAIHTLALPLASLVHTPDEVKVGQPISPNARLAAGVVIPARTVRGTSGADASAAWRAKRTRAASLPSPAGDRLPPGASHTQRSPSAYWPSRSTS